MSSTEFVYMLLRLQFGVSASFHFLFVPLSIGLLMCVNVLQTRQVLTGEAKYAHAARFWRRFFLLCWVVGVCTGYPMRWQLQTNWGSYLQAATPVFNEIFAIEGAVGPLMLAGVAITMFGRRFVGERLHMAAGWILLLLLGMQSLTILAVNAWMQHPVGVSFDDAGWRLQSLAQILWSDTAIHKFWHTLSGAALSGAVFVLAVSACLLVRKRHLDMAGASVRSAAWVGMLGVLSVLVSGHESAAGVAKDQPMKFAAFEGHWQRDDGPAPLVLFALPDESANANRFEIHVPYLMSLMATGTLESPPGINDLTRRNEHRLAYALTRPDDARQKGYLMLYNAVSERYADQWATWTREERIAKTALAARPAVAPLFWAFHVMVGSGVALLALCTWVFIKREELARGSHTWLLNLVRWGAPLPWVAILSGWAVAEVGRQPWVVHEQLPTFHAMLAPPIETAVLNVFIMFTAGLLIAATFALFALKAYRARIDANRLDFWHFGGLPAPAGRMAQPPQWPQHQAEIHNVGQREQRVRKAA